MTHIGHSEKVFNMKRLLLILILTFSFQIFAKAADIRDFQIEGMSIGDSALQYFDKDDEQSKHLKIMVDNFGEKYVLRKICGLQNNEPLVNFCLNQKLF